MSRCTRGGIAPDEQIVLHLVIQKKKQAIKGCSCIFPLYLIVQPLAHPQGAAISAFLLSVMERFSNDITAYSCVFRSEDLKSATSGLIGSTSVCLQGFRI
jgi:hypothetical protein